PAVAEREHEVGVLVDQVRGHLGAHRVDKRTRTHDPHAASANESERRSWQPGRVHPVSRITSTARPSRLTGSPRMMGVPVSRSTPLAQASTVTGAAAWLSTNHSRS